MGSAELPDPPPDIEDMLAELAGCVDAYPTGGDPARLLSESALRLAADVAARIESDGRGRVTIAQARVLGLFHWLRYCLKANDNDGKDDQAVALRYLTALAGGDLASVPRELQVLLSGSKMVGDGPYEWFQQGLVLLARAETEPDTAALTRSIELFRMALETPGLPTTDVATMSSHLGMACRIRYERRLAPEDLSEAVRASRLAAEMAHSNGAEQAVHLARLSAALQTQYRHSGDRRDLDEAIAVTRTALTGLDNQHPSAVVCRINGSVGLYLRFTEYGALEDLDEAIEMAGAVETALPSSRTDGERSHALSVVAATNVSVYLQNRYERVGSTGDLDDGISVGKWAVAHTSDDHPDYASKLSNLCAGLLVRYRRHGAATDLDEAVDLAERAVHAVAAGDWNSAICWSTLADALHHRYRRDGTPADLDLAVDADRHAVAEATDRHGGVDLFRRRLSLILLTRFDRDGQPEDLVEACTLLQSVYRSGTAPASMRLASAASVLAIPRFEASQRLEAGVAAVDLLPMVAWFALGRQDQEKALSEARGISTDAAAHAITTEHTVLALELVEQGRAVLWMHALNLRIDLTVLKNTQPEIAARLDAIRRELGAPSIGVASNVGLTEGSVTAPMSCGGRKAGGTEP